MRTPEEVYKEMRRCWGDYFDKKLVTLHEVDQARIEILRSWMNEIKAGHEKTNLGDSQDPGCGPDGCVCADGDSGNKLK